MKQCAELMTIKGYPMRCDLDKGHEGRHSHSETFFGQPPPYGNTDNFAFTWSNVPKPEKKPKKKPTAGQRFVQKTGTCREISGTSHCHLFESREAKQRCLDCDAVSSTCFDLGRNSKKGKKGLKPAMTVQEYAGSFSRMEWEDAMNIVRPGVDISGLGPELEAYRKARENLINDYRNLNVGCIITKEG